MKSRVLTAVILGCVTLICASALAWHYRRVRAAQRRLAEEVRRYRTLAERGDAEAQFKLGSRYYYGKGVPRDYSQALRWYTKAAGRGNAEGEYALGFMYAEGVGVQKDSTAALDLCRKAADQGYARAEYSLGYVYYEGKLVPQSDRDAVAWYGKAADQGHAAAQSYLGYMYANGRGVAQDYTEAVRWYRRAAEQGYAKAQDGLGYAYSQGRGVPRDYSEAARWYWKASRQGDEYGRSALRSMSISCGIVGKLTLLATSATSVLLLIPFLFGVRDHHQRKPALAGLLGLVWAGITLSGYSQFGILQALSMGNLFLFTRDFVGGSFAALLASVVSSRAPRTVLVISGILFVAFNIYAITHYDLRHFAACPRSFYSLNGLCIGAAVCSAMLVIASAKSLAIQDGDDTPRSGSESQTFETSGT